MLPELGVTRPEMVPKGFSWIIYLNPIYYMTEMYRGTMLSGTSPSVPVVIAYVLMCIATFALGSAFFERFRGVLTAAWKSGGRRGKPQVALTPEYSILYSVFAGRGGSIDSDLPIRRTEPTRVRGKTRL